ncbi:MAG: T9SS type A sorting domain-containing protein [Tannerella sp.]|jgi:poly(3-hydroxybutyrate) depolymerase|nr:T9SS type A sorting domain-containing protein [Tannerella sp.]
MLFFQKHGTDGRRFLLSWVFLLLPVILTAANPEKKTMRSGGLEREYLIYTPPHVSGKPEGLLICLHGFNGSMQDFFDNYALFKVADSLHYLIVAPQALPEQDPRLINLAKALDPLLGNKILSGWGLHLDAAWGCGLRVKAVSKWLGITLLDEELNRPVDDVAFIRQLIERTTAEYALSPVDNIFLIGTSMGGYMCYQYALKQPVKPAGIISLVGSMGLNIRGMGEGMKTPLCDFHSITDEVVPYAGSFDSDGITISLAQPKADVISYWVKTNGAGAPVTETVARYPSVNGITVEKITYPHPAYEVVHYRMNGAGHSYFFRRENGDCMDYLEEATAFILAHARSGTNALQTVTTQEVWTFPNPATQTLYFTTPLSGRATIFDRTGKAIRTHVLLDAEQMDISTLPSGLYILRVRTDGGVLRTAKFLKR